ncbi:MAG: DUF2478 domain-containing protein [Chlorobi bacterium]|nr:DUF2478 domain-containing protein [Chlorobiota bacterium]
MQNMIFLITGPQGSGKTTFLIELVSLLKKKGISTGGFVAHGFWKDNVRDGFELEDLQTGEKIVLSQTVAMEGWEKFRRFYFNPGGFAFGEGILSPVKLRDVDLIVVDEIGPFELQGRGWRKAIDKLIKETDKPMVWVCRESILKELVKEFKLQSYHVFNIQEEGPEKVARMVLPNL